MEEFEIIPLKNMPNLNSIPLKRERGLRIENIQIIFQYKSASAYWLAVAINHILSDF